MMMKTNLSIKQDVLCKNEIKRRKILIALGTNFKETIKK